MHITQGKPAPNIFLPKFRKPSLSYPTQFPHLRHMKPISKLDKCKHGTSCREPFVWNNILNTTDNKSLMSVNLKL